MAGHSWKLLLLLSIVSCLPHSYVAQEDPVGLDISTDTNETNIDLSNGDPGDIGEPEPPKDTPDPKNTTVPPKNGENLFAEVTTVGESVSTSTATVTTSATTTSPPPTTTVSEEIPESTSPPTTTPPSENPPSPPTTPPPSQRPSDNSHHKDTSE